MSNIKISELGQAGTLTGVELAPIVQDNETVRTTLNQIKAFAGIAISNDIIGDAASTTLAPSVNAIKTYTDGLVVGLLNDRGNYTPDGGSPGDYPSSGGSGVVGAIQKGDIWFINGNGFLGTTAVVIGASVRALVSSPSPTTDSDWDILDAGLIQATLQTVLNAGFTASDSGGGINIITLTNSSGTTYSTLGKNFLNFYAPTKSSVYNVDGFNVVDASGDYINGSVDRLKVYDVTTNNSTELKFNSVKYNNSAFVGSLETSTLTSSQTWTLPNATGTIALTNNIWNATGNSGTIAGTNFLGTIDTVDLVLKTNNLERIRVANTGGVIISDLAGTGTRTVVASPTGQLSTTISSSGWSTLGNASTSPLTNFIGTTDANALVFKVNNIERLRIYTNGLVENSGAGFSSVSSSGSNIEARNSSGTKSIELNTLLANPKISITSGSYSGSISLGTLTTSQTYTLPNASGTIALTSDIISPTLQVVTSGTNKNLTNGINLQGTNAGDTPTGSFSDINAFGTNAVNANTNASYINAFGGGAAANNNGVSHINAMGIGAAAYNTSSNHINAFGFAAANNNGSSVTNINAIGRNAAINNSGSGVNALGRNAASGNTGTDVNFLGYYSGAANTGNYVNGLGFNAAKGNLGSDTNALGTNAALDNQGQYVNAIGNQAASGNVSTHVNAIGQYAAYQNLGNYTNAIGLQAAQGNEGFYVNAIGFSAAQDNSALASHVNAFGSYAAYQNQGENVNAIGQASGQSNTGYFVNALGQQSAQSNGGDNVNAFGYEAARNNTNTGNYVNAFGYQAAKGNIGAYVNALGSNALENNTGSDVNAFGNQAGIGNTINGATIFSNTSLPSYANYAAAAVAITVLLGASANCTYLYHDQATNSIGAVRL